MRPSGSTGMVSPFQDQLTGSLNSPLPGKVTQSQILGIKMWASPGAVVLMTAWGIVLEKWSLGSKPHSHPPQEELKTEPSHLTQLHVTSSRKPSVLADRYRRH